MTNDILAIDELEVRTALQGKDARVTITPLGKSRTGHSIDMISIGEGDNDALVVGVPHCNEPIGAMTIERMIDLLLADAAAARGYRWHFIKAIDPDGLALNEGWLKGPRTLTRYLENFFRPALHRQPETTFPLDIPEARFTACTPENEAWQRALALTRPSLHASLHHCDFGGIFYCLSRALPSAVPRLEASLRASGLDTNDLDGGIFAAERWASGITRYPSVPELIAKAQAVGASWVLPWNLGEMSPGFAEAAYGTFTIVPEVPMWDASTLHSEQQSDLTHSEHRQLLNRIAKDARNLATRHIDHLASCLLSPDAMAPDAMECLWAIRDGLKMMASSDAEEDFELPTEGAAFSRRKFETLHTQQILFTLRTYGLVIRLCDLILADDPSNDIAVSARQDAQHALRAEIAEIEAHTPFVPVPLEVTTRLQMEAVFICADALAGR